MLPLLVLLATVKTFDTVHTEMRQSVSILRTLNGIIIAYTQIHIVMLSERKKFRPIPYVYLFIYSFVFV